MPREVYIQGNSKADINRRLAKGEAVTYTEYSLLSSHIGYVKDLPNGTIVKVYKDIVSGSPYTKAYGSMKQGKVS
jgi:hypothetical protein